MLKTVFPCMPASKYIPDSTHCNSFLWRVSQFRDLCCEGYNMAYLLFIELGRKKKTWLPVPMGITLLCSLSLSSLCHAVNHLFIYHLSILDFCCCCAFVSFLVMSGKLKCHPSPIHRTWQRRGAVTTSPHSILLPSLLHHPISTLVSVVTGNSHNGT